MPDTSNTLSTFSTSSSLILYSAPRAATAARGVREVAKPPSGTRGSRRLPKGKEQRRWSPALRPDWNAGVFQRAMRLPAFTKQHKCSRAATCTGDYCTEVAAHAPEGRLKGESHELLSSWVSRRSEVIDSCLLWLSKSPQRASAAFIQIKTLAPNAQLLSWWWDSILFSRVQESLHHISNLFCYYTEIQII